MDFELTDEQRLVRETARSFTDDQIVPRAKVAGVAKPEDISVIRTIDRKDFYLNYTNCTADSFKNGCGGFPHRSLVLATRQRAFARTFSRPANSILS